MQAKCDICKSDKRSIKFSSKRVKICQWCVSFLCRSPINPDVIESELNQLIYGYVSNLQEFRMPSKKNIRNEAIKEIGRISFFDKIFLFLFNKESYNKRRKLIEEKTNHEFATVKSDIENKIKYKCNNLMTDILEWINVPKKLYAIGLYLPRFFYKEIIPKKYIKYIHAINKKIIAGQTKIIRPSKDEWKGIRKRILSEDGYHCRLCAKNNVELHIHHIIPLSKYGTNELNNLISICLKCHIKIHPKLELITKRK